MVTAATGSVFGGDGGGGTSALAGSVCGGGGGSNCEAQVEKAAMPY